VLLRQLLLILLDNAIKFSPAGGEVEGSVTARNRLASVCIRDYGPGIPDEALPHIFERFYRADPGRTGVGAGIGLSIAAVIGQAHNARIRVDSAVGVGTTVCIELPLAPALAGLRPQVGTL
jgi:signal transduction histidine kinase